MGSLTRLHVGFWRARNTCRILWQNFGSRSACQLHTTTRSCTRFVLFCFVFIFGGEGGHCMYLFKKSMHVQFQWFVIVSICLRYANATQISRRNFISERQKAIDTYQIATTHLGACYASNHGPWPLLFYILSLVRKWEANPPHFPQVSKNKSDHVINKRESDMKLYMSINIIRGEFGHNQSKSQILMFANPIGYMLWSSSFSFKIWSIFHRYP